MFVSQAQRRWGHSPSGLAALGKRGVAEFDRATAGHRLPERVDDDEADSIGDRLTRRADKKKVLRFPKRET